MVFNPDLVRRITPLIQQRTHTLGEYASVADFFFGNVNHVTPETRKQGPKGWEPIPGLVPKNRERDEAWFALNEVQGALADAVRTHGGMVDKFMGDGMLAVFGAPEKREDHADCAVAAAESMLVAVRRIAPDVRLGIGVHTGEVVIGCLGSGPRMEFTVLGDTVNTAARMESHGVPGRIQVTTRVRAALQDRYAFHPRGAIDVKGKGEMQTWWLVGEK